MAWRRPITTAAATASAMRWRPRRRVAGRTPRRSTPPPRSRQRCARSNTRSTASMPIRSSAQRWPAWRRCSMCCTRRWPNWSNRPPRRARSRYARSWPRWRKTAPSRRRNSKRSTTWCKMSARWVFLPSCWPITRPARASASPSTRSREASARCRLPRWRARNRSPCSTTRYRRRRPPRRRRTLCRSWRLPPTRRNCWHCSCPRRASRSTLSMPRWAPPRTNSA